jgi:hypothetical protein
MCYELMLMVNEQFISELMYLDSLHYAVLRLKFVDTGQQCFAKVRQAIYFCFLARFKTAVTRR